LALPGDHALARDDDVAVRRCQYTAIDDTTRVRALKVFCRHTQVNAIDFINYGVEKLPFRICAIQTDRGHEEPWTFVPRQRYSTRVLR